MSRIDMVTRTVLATKVVFTVAKISEQTIEEMEATVKGTYDDTAKLLKVLDKKFSNDELKVLAVKSFDEVQTLYGMKTEDFIANAVELEPETRKPIA